MLGCQVGSSPGKRKQEVDAWPLGFQRWLPCFLVGGFRVVEVQGTGLGCS